MKTRNCIVIIPVFNQGDLVRKCIASVARNTDPSEAAVIIADDASTERGLSEYLREFCSTHTNWFYIRSEVNRGFGATVNEALCDFQDDDDDAIILNSDTEVPPRWVERLYGAIPDVSVDEETGYCHVAAVCPVSNYATIYSVPNPGSNNLPAWCSTDQMDHYVEECSESEHPCIPTVMGFCMLLTHEALAAVGEFDAAFGKGYGEEVDWCMRANALGFTCRLADDLFVWHKGQASFGDSPERDELRRNAIRIVDERYPHYADCVREWYLGAPLTRLRVRLMLALQLRDEPELDRSIVVHVAHNYGTPGGVENSIRVAALRDPSNLHVVIYPRYPHLAEGACEWDADGVLRVTASPELVGASMTVGGHAFSASDVPAGKRIARWFNRVLRGLGISYGDTIRFEHFAGWAGAEERMLSVASSSFARVVVALHDVYQKCPMLLRGGACSYSGCEQRRECVECVKSAAVFKRPVHDTNIANALASHGWRFSLLRAQAPQLEAPSVAHARAMGVPLAHCEIVAPAHQRPRRPQRALSDGRPRVAFVGGATDSKGWQAFADAARKEPHQYRWSVIGPVDPECDVSGLEHVAFRGAYRPEELGGYLASVDVAVPAVARTESYGIVASECALAVSRVVVPDLPVMRERFDASQMYTWGDSDTLLRALAGEVRKDSLQHLKSNWAFHLANAARVAVSPRSATKEGRAQWLQQIGSWGINSVFNAPEGWDVKLLESNGRGWEGFDTSIKEANEDFMIALAGEVLQ